ncbi:MAG: hypothetical protein Q9M31_00570 [Mariprofundus sp.]|nr:hypothetical protein [Mariprofundus sp.]
MDKRRVHSKKRSFPEKDKNIETELAVEAVEAVAADMKESPAEVITTDIGIDRHDVDQLVSEPENVVVEAVVVSSSPGEEKEELAVTSDADDLNTIAEKEAAQKAVEAKALEEKAAAALAEAEKVEAEQAAAEKAAAGKAAARTAAAKSGADEAAARLAAEKAAAEKAEADKVVAEKAAAEKAEAEKAAVEKAEAEKSAAEKAAVEKAEAEKAAVEKAEAEKAAVEKVEAEKDAAAKRAKTDAAPAESGDGMSSFVDIEVEGLFDGVINTLGGGLGKVFSSVSMTGKSVATAARDPKAAMADVSSGVRQGADNVKSRVSKILGTTEK